MSTQPVTTDSRDSTPTTANHPITRHPNWERLMDLVLAEPEPEQPAEPAADDEAAA